MSDDLDALQIFVKRDVIHCKLWLVCLSKSTVSVQVCQNWLVWDHIKSWKDRLFSYYSHRHNCAVIAFVMCIVRDEVTFIVTRHFKQRLIKPELLQVIRV